MPEETDQVFTIKNGEVKETYSSFSFEDNEIFGTKLEDALQTLIEKTPERVVPGSQIAPGSDSPPRFMVLNREMPVKRWSLDVLLIDQYATPTLLEAKLFRNREAKREVVGQIMNYAANAEEAWSGGTLRERAKSYWSDKDENLNDKLRDLLSTENPDIDDFWNRAENNLESNNIRLIIAMEEFRPEARKIIEFLNEEMENVELLGLDVRCYGDSDEDMIVAPLILGQTQSTAPTSTQKTLTAEELKAKYERISDETLRERLIELVEWAEEENIRKPLNDSRLSLMGEIEVRRILDIYKDGKADVYINEKDFPDEKIRDDWLSSLSDLSFCDFDESIVEDYSLYKKTGGSIGTLSEDEYKEFRNILQEFCGT
ncbi:MAG: hypothetical protein V5A57_03135 [Candidatus Paceibacterota bacterium]